MNSLIFQDMIAARNARGAHLCVGLDPSPVIVKRLHKQDPQGIRDWLMSVVDMTAPYAASFKPNLQFYLNWGWQGIKILEELNDWMRLYHPDIPRILDAKWGDIGATNLGSLAFAQKLGVQAITVHNYMGMEAMRDLLENLFCFVLCKTSNPGAHEFQDLPLLPLDRLDVLTLSQTVARHVATSWTSVSKNKGCGLVVGATLDPVEIRSIDKTVSGLIFLIPGVGTQGGSVNVALSRVRHNHPLVNVSSAITKAGDPAAVAKDYNDQIQEALRSWN